MLRTTSRAPIPPLARKFPFFYGWLIVAVAMASSFVGAGLNNVAMAVVFKPLSEDMGWSRSLTAGAIAAGTVLGGLIAPLFGRLADRAGPRLLVPAGAAVTAMAVLGISVAVEPWHFYVGYVPARALAQTLLFGVVPMTAVANWFYLKRSRAMGMVSMAVPMGSSALALVFQYLISSFGWRSVFLLLAFLLLVAVVVPGSVFLRRQPEDVGLHPDGPGPATARTERAERRRGLPTEYSWTLREALGTPALWLVTTGVTLAVIATGGVAFNMVAYLTDMGVDPYMAAGVLSLFSLSGGVAAGLWGLLAERASVRGLSAGAMLLAAIGVVLLLHASTPALAFLFAVLFGLGARGEEALVRIVLAEYYGRHSFGAINGFTEPFWRTGLGIGPLIAAAAFDLTGSYRGILTIFAGVFVVSALLMLLARRPAPRGQGA